MHSFYSLICFIQQTITIISILFRQTGAGVRFDEIGNIQRRVVEHGKTPAGVVGEPLLDCIYLGQYPYRCCIYEFTRRCSKIHCRVKGPEVRTPSKSRRTMFSNGCIDHLGYVDNLLPGAIVVVDVVIAAGYLSNLQFGFPSLVPEKMQISTRSLPKHLDALD